MALVGAERRVSTGLISIGLLAAGLGAVVKAMDNITAHHFIVSSDRATAAFTYLVIGGWTGLVIGTVFAVLFGKRFIDPDFAGLSFGTLRMHWYAFWSGGIGAAGTLFFLWATQLGDPSALTALSAASLVYVGLYDIWTKRVTARSILPPILAASVGSGLAAYNGSIAATLAGVVLVLGLSNLMSSASEIFEKIALDPKTKEGGVRPAKVDAVTFYLWRFFWLAACGTVLALVTAMIRGKAPLLVGELGEGIRYLPFIILTMMVQFFGGGLKTFLKKSHAVSIVVVLFAIQIVAAYPITILGELIAPGLFGGIPTSVVVWTVRILGASLLIWGVIEIKRQDDEAKKQIT